ncbi:MAG: nucleoside 2-deoxyribosyltransferase [Parcubacteria group bacterium Gr01-1014_20]|nr:MAG: nucleoside 2-deoxyribosyltransferase [Parcubacteria group bacterium Gr01-1014_20]
MKKPIIYLAGPLGFSEVGRLFHEQVVLPMVGEIGYDVRDPWALTSEEEIEAVSKMPRAEERRERWFELNRVMGERNAEAIRESDVIMAVLDGVDVDSGTASEVGFGFALGKKIIGYRGDFRLSSDNEGSVVNLQVEHFILQSGGWIVFDVNKLRLSLQRVYTSLVA